jgi:hypothetical protein
MKYIITFLSTTPFLSLMLHIANYDNMYYIAESEKISNEIIKSMSNRMSDLELQIAD